MSEYGKAKCKKFKQLNRNRKKQKINKVGIALEKQGFIVELSIN